MKSKLTKCEALVAYFDIFGFSELLKATAVNIQGRAEILRTAKFQSMRAKSLRSLANSLQDIWNWILTDITKTESVRAFLFSDCGFILYRVADGNNNEMLIHCVGDLVLLFDKYLEKGFLLRGGIACGPVFHQDNLLIGEAVAEAVYIESALCPGPFIIFPYKEYQKLLKEEDEPLIKTLDFSILNLKNDMGKIECHVIFPADKRNYIRKVQLRANYYLRYGPPIYAKFWHDTYQFLISEFQKEFQGFL